MMETDDLHDYVPSSLVVVPPKDSDGLHDIKIAGQPAGTLRGDFVESFAEMVTGRCCTAFIAPLSSISMVIDRETCRT